MTSSSTSPSSVRWQLQQQQQQMYRHYYNKNPPAFLQHDEEGENSDEDYYSLSEAWQVPSSQEMKRRQELRQRIREETLQHRRVHRHGGMKGRNICFVLQDRQVTGKLTSMMTTSTTARRRYPASHINDDNNNNNSTTTTPTSTTPPTIATPPPTTMSTTLLMSPMSIQKEIQCFSEYCSVLRYHSAFLSHLGGQDVVESLQQQQQHGPASSSSSSRHHHHHHPPRLPNSSKAISTISIAFSPDAKTMASTHGDHTVKITGCASGFLLETLEGHPRTPWTVKYHPTDPAILASGCLGHQVRLWNWTTKTCLRMIRLEFAIISLSFHPSGKVLAIANGTRLHFWSIPLQQQQQSTESSNTTVPTSSSSGSGDNNNNNNSNATSRSNNNATGATDNSLSSSSSNVMTEVEQRHMLRCVHFPPNGNTIIVGGVNPPTTDSTHSQSSSRSGGGVSGGGMSFYLRLWDFDLQAALRPGEITHMGLRRRAIGNPRTFVPRALLYNDGGFDVSPDGKTLCACAEYWLPDGVDSAMELLQRQQQQQQQEEEEEDDGWDDEVEDTGSSNDDDDNADDEVFEDGENDSEGNDGQQQQQQDDDPGDDATPDQSQQPHQAPQISPPRAQIAPMVPGGQAAAPRGILATPQTPPTSTGRASFALSPPSPPGRRFAGGLGQPNHQPQQPQRGSLFDASQGATTTASTSRPTHPPPPQRHPAVPPNPASMAGTGSASSSNTTTPTPSSNQQQYANPSIPPPPPPGMNRPPNPFSTLNTSNNPNNNASSSTYNNNTNNAFYNLDPSTTLGRYVPHVVTISMDTTPVINSDIVPGRNLPRNPPHHHPHHPAAAATSMASFSNDGSSSNKKAKAGNAATTNSSNSSRKSSASQQPPLRPRLGQLLEACPLDGAKASAVTCVKFSPSTNFCLIGYGVRETLVEHNGNHYHPVTALYKIKGGMTHVSTMLSGDDDVNIARFHPDSGYGFVYGTKQGRVRVLSPRPWNYYNC